MFQLPRAYPHGVLIHFVSRINIMRVHINIRLESSVLYLLRNMQHAGT